MKSNLSKNTLIALAFVVSLGLFIFGLNYLKGVSVLKKQNKYVAVFDDVLGLNVSSPIYINGFQIGLVNSIKMISEKPVKIGVEILLDKGFRVKKGSRLEFGADLLGGSSCKLVVNEYASEYLNLGDTIQGERAQGMMDEMARVVPRADAIMMSVDSIMLTLNRLMSDPAWQQSVQGVNQTVQSLNLASANLNKVLISLNQEIPTISNNLSVASSDLKSVSGKLDQLDLDKTYQSLDATIANLKDLSQKMNSTDNSMGKLMNSPELHDSLNTTLNNAAMLLEDIRKNPRKYLSVKVRLF